MKSTSIVGYDIWLWLLAGCCACLFALYPLSGTLVNGIYLPADADSFYHAHRILDALANPGHLIQFDTRIHAPEGSWITWPWAYDMAMAWIAHVAVYMFGVSQPLSVLAYVAPLWTFVNAALILGICNRLRLSFPFKAVALFCFACLPLTQALHRVGMLDHHFIEFSFVLAMVYCGLGWFCRLNGKPQAAILGTVLGMAPAFHNGLFILQLPVLGTWAMLWLLQRPRSSVALPAFTAGLMVSSLLFLLPSEPFRRGMFAFELQSWFHLYVAAMTCVFTALFALLPRSRRSILLVVATTVLALIPIYGLILRAGAFLSGNLADLADIDEVKGVFHFITTGDFSTLSETYSGLIWLLPLFIVALCWRLRFRSDAGDIFFVVASIGGVALLQQQYRLEDYGSFALYLPLCLLAQDASEHWPQAATRIIAALAATVAVAYFPAFAELRAKATIGGSYDYQMTRGIYPYLAVACDKQPGVVLADSSDGHFLTFHTRCAVIADSFIMTPQHERKLLEVDHLLNGSVAEVLQEAPEVRYIMVRRNDNVFASSCKAVACPENRGLRQELLFPAGPLPATLRLIGEVRIENLAGDSEPLVRAFEVVNNRMASPGGP
jgi:hypothetical protein